MCNAVYTFIIALQIVGKGLTFKIILDSWNTRNCIVEGEPGGLHLPATPGEPRARPLLLLL